MSGARRRRVLSRAVTAAALFVGSGLCGCATGSRSAAIRSVAAAWPSGDPRVRLETTIEPDAARGSGRFRRVMGLEPAATERGILVRPYGVAWSGDALLISDPGRGCVTRVEPSGKVVSSSPGLFESPIGIASCDVGIVVSDSARGFVALLDERLSLVRRIAEDLDRPTGISCDGDRLLVVETGRHRIVSVDPAGPGASFGGRGDGPGEFNFPTAMVVDGGDLWVVDALNFRVQRLDARSGAFRNGFGGLGDAPGEMPRSKGIGIDAAGHVWLSDALLDRVSIFDRSGTFLVSIGASGSGPGEFTFPAGIAAHPDGRVAVVDSLNRRVQVFRILETGG